MLDDLSTGDPARLPAGVPLVVAGAQDQPALARVLRQHDVQGVVHLAARKSVTESVARPAWYHAQNVGGLSSVLTAMATAGVHRIVFSSSAAVYGTPSGRVTESAPPRPVNPYGHSKLLGERLLRAAARDGVAGFAALRYFNVAGAASPELADRAGVNLIPLALRALHTGAPITVTGVDYPTRDGSGVRDYVHVQDVARAHAAAVARLLPAGRYGAVFNVGTGCGYSVLEVLRALGEAAGAPVPRQSGPRRPGDPAEVVADVRRIRRELRWSARFDLADMLTSAWHASTATRSPGRQLAAVAGA